LEEEVPAGVVTLVVEDSKGHRQAITLSGPGGRIRIAVGEPGRRSGVWNVWANRGKSDVYIAARSIAGVQKYSLHETGDWRHQWTTQEQAEKFTGQRDRMLDRWERPDGGPGGWTRGLAIWVPQPDILDIPQDDQSHEGVTWLPEPSPGFAIGIHVVVAKTDRGLVPVKGAVPVEAFTLANGEVVLVLVSRAELTDERRQWLDKERARARAASGHIDLTAVKAPRMTLFGYDDHGNRVLWDLAAQT
jgi:hypothetical protein